MAAPVQQTSTITAKGQTTIPKAVRRALGVGYGDRIAFRVEDNVVTVHRADSDVEDPAIDTFLAFLAEDMERRPEAIAALSPVLLERIAKITQGIDIDLDAPIEGDVDL